MSSDSEILPLEGLAKALGLSSDDARMLLESGELPGRKIGDRWYTTRKQLVEYIEGGAAKSAPPSPQAPASTPSTSPVASSTRAPRADGAWVCGSCHCLNSPERVECLDCGAARLGPLINYMPPGRVN